MNAGLIPARYASALLDFASQSGLQERVYQEVKCVAHNFFEINQLRGVIDNPVLANAKKREIIITAAGGNVSKAFDSFVSLILENKREVHLQSILLKYIDLYRKQNNIHYGKLTTASPVNNEIEIKLTQLVEKTTGVIIEMEKGIYEAFLGGFMFEVDFVRWDASVSGQLRRIRNEYIEKNKKTI